MSLQDLTLLKQIARGFFSLTLAFVVLLGGWILLSAFNSAPDTQFVLEAGQPKFTDHSSRSPQSVGGRFAGAVGDLAEKSLEVKVETLDLGCVERAKPVVTLKSSAKQMRIRARYCTGGELSFAESSILNRANGYMATLFNLEKGGFTSDYISLSDGANQISFQVTGVNGDHYNSNIQVERLTELSR